MNVNDARALAAGSGWERRARGRPATRQQAARRRPLSRSWRAARAADQQAAQDRAVSGEGVGPAVVPRERHAVVHAVKRYRTSKATPRSSPQARAARLASTRISNVSAIRTLTSASGLEIGDVDGAFCGASSFVHAALTALFLFCCSLRPADCTPPRCLLATGRSIRLTSLTACCTSRFPPPAIQRVDETTVRLRVFTADGYATAGHLERHIALVASATSCPGGAGRGRG